MIRRLPGLVAILLAADLTGQGSVYLEYRDDRPDRPQGAIEFHAAAKPGASLSAAPTIVADGGVVSDVFTSQDYSNCAFTVSSRPAKHQHSGSVVVKFASPGFDTRTVTCPLQYYPSGAISVGVRPLSKTDEFLVGGVAEDVPRFRISGGADPVKIFAVNESSGDVRMGNEFELLVGCSVGVKGIRFKTIDCDQGDCGAGPDYLSSEGWMHLWYRPWDKHQHLVGGTRHIKLTFVDHRRGNSVLTRAISVTVAPDGTSRLNPRLPSVLLFHVPAGARR